MWWLTFSWIIVTALHVIGFIAGIHALMNKRDSRSALGWLAVCIGIPGIGALLYVIFGLNRIKNVARQWESRGLWHIGNTDSTLSQPGDSQDYAKGFDKRAFRAITETGDYILEQPITPGCDVEPLFDGTQAYPQMIETIQQAKQSVYLCTYIFGTTGVGEAFIDALDQAMQRGVDVKVLVDGVGGLYSWPTAAYKLRRRGVKVAYFLPLFRNWYYTMHLNLRHHRKILVVDGEVAFTGGMNIHEHNVDHGDEPPLVHDLHFRVQGPIVGFIQDVFLKGWYFSTKEPIKKVVYYDDTPKGDMLCRGVPAGPHQKYALVQNILIAAINSAQKHIRIMTPYFVLGSSLRSAINAAALRGVKVEVILPENNNLRFVKGAVESILPGLLDRGVKVYYRKGHFAHTKLFLADDFFALVGSSNLDMRSLQLNFEFNLEIYSKPLVKQLIDYFDAIQSNSEQITQNWLASQSFWVKLRNAFFRLFAPYL